MKLLKCYRSGSINLHFKGEVEIFELRKFWFKQVRGGKKDETQKFYSFNKD